MVQAAHAAHESGLRSPIADDPLSLVLCQAKDELEIEIERQRLVRWNIPHVLFREPDIENQATALATLPINAMQRKLLSSWQLWR